MQHQAAAMCQRKRHDLVEQQVTHGAGIASAFEIDVDGVAIVRERERALVVESQHHRVPRLSDPQPRNGTAVRRRLRPRHGRSGEGSSCGPDAEVGGTIHRAQLRQREIAVERVTVGRVPHA